MKTLNKILLGIGILTLIIIIANLYLYFSHPFIIKLIPIEQIKI